VPVVTVQNRYSLADRSYESVLDHCGREKIGFIPWNPINAGNLNALGNELQRVALHHKITTAQVALAWLLWRSPVMLPIPGTSRVVHLEENVAAATLKFDDGELEALGQAP
jgi:pyridoxine 4-dehydrogenase